MVLVIGATLLLRRRLQRHSRVKIGMFRRLKRWAKSLNRDVIAVWLAARDRRVSWHVKVIAGAIAAYAFSPIDLIPDFIPVLGYLDDLIIVPTGIWLVVRLIPAPLMAEFRDEAAKRRDRPVSYVAASLIALLWLALAAGLIWLYWDQLIASLRRDKSGMSL